MKSIIKKRIFLAVFKICKWIERKFSLRCDNYEGEEAPYCGHHYSGYTTVLTYSDNFEGDGVEGIHIKNWCWQINHSLSNYGTPYFIKHDKDLF